MKTNSIQSSNAVKNAICRVVIFIFYTNNYSFNIFTVIIADYGGCSGRKPSATNAKGETIFCSGSPNQQIKCPIGFRCQNLAFYGVCCNIKNEGESWGNIH